MPTEKGQKKN